MRCSNRCASPRPSLASFAAPTWYQTCVATTGIVGSGTIVTSRPLASVVWTSAVKASAVSMARATLLRRAPGGLSGERFFEVCDRPREPRATQHRGPDESAPEQGLLPHLTEQRPHREFGERNDGGTMERTAELLRELALRQSARRHDVHRAGNLVVPDEVVDRVDRIVECDPREHLAAASDRPARSELERKAHLGQGAASRAQDHAETQGHRPDSGRPGGLGRL